MKNYLILFFIIISVTSYSQNYLFDVNSSGFSIGGQLTSTDGSTLFAVFPAYTSNGKLSVGLGIGYESNNRIDVHSSAIKPNFSYLVMKQGENENPVSVALNGSYQFNTFSKPKGQTASTIGFGGSFHHKIQVSETVQIIPGAAVGWNRVSVRRDGAYSGDDSGIVYGLLGTLKYKKLYFEPAIYFRDGNSIINLSAGLIFPD